MKQLITMDQAAMAAWAGGIVIGATIVASILGTDFGVSLVVILALFSVLMSIRDRIGIRQALADTRDEADALATQLRMLSAIDVARKEESEASYQRYVDLDRVKVAVHNPKGRPKDGESDEYAANPQPFGVAAPATTDLHVNQ